jgi:hypothetical protein
MDSDETVAQAMAIVPRRAEVVDFYGDPIPAVQAADETIYVPVRAISDNLGLDWPSQYKRLKRDEVLAEALRSVQIQTADRGARAMVCLPLNLLPGWLFGLSESRVRADLQDKIKRYRRECFDVLWNAFKGGVVADSQALAPLSGAEMALEIAEAVAALARQQVELESRYNTMADYMRSFVRETRDHQRQTDGRLTALELKVGDATSISEEQAAELALAVKAVGQALAAQGDKSGYGRVYGELYRRYSISSYKRLPAAQYEACLAWLHGWYEEVRGPAPEPAP